MKVAQALRIANVLWGERTIKLFLGPADDPVYTFRKYWIAGLSTDVVQFLLSHCVCMHCGRAVEPALASCPCDQAEYYHLEVEYDRLAHDEEFKRLCNREKSRRGSLARRTKVISAGEAFTRQEVRDLLSVQEGMCFFCLATLADAQGKHRHHADHIVPLGTGGPNSIQNIVLTCARCNLKKNTRDAAEFDRTARSWRPLNSTKELRRLRRQVREWKQRREGKGVQQ